MGHILGLGVTHSPPLLSASGDTASRIKRMMQDPLLPECYRSPATWPEPMRLWPAVGQRRGPDARPAASR
jgi:hypothetical protein